jgi:hypothetical protein
MTIDIEEETSSLPMPPPGYCHQFHADVHALRGDFRAPILQRIEPHIPITLNDRRGGHLTRYIEDVNIEGLIFVKRAFTRVSGSISEKHGAWVTLAATVLEGVNFLEVLTADRVVAQVSTEHAFRDGHVPRVSFLGTKFENLKINGIPVGIEYDFDVCGPKPARDQPYNTNETFTAQARERMREIANSEFLFGRARTNYAGVQRAMSQPFGETIGSNITCSVVRRIIIDEVREQLPGVQTVGHLLAIPDFGVVALGEVIVGLENPTPITPRGPICESTNGNPQRLSNYFELTMLNMELGCVGTGSVQVGKTKTNGNTNP